MRSADAYVFLWCFSFDEYGVVDRMDGELLTRLIDSGIFYILCGEFSNWDRP